MDLKSVFQDLGLFSFGSTSVKGWYGFNNPMDDSGKPTAARVNFDAGMVKDHRLSYTKPIYRFLMDAFGYSYQEAIKLADQPEPSLIKAYAPKVKETILPKGYKNLYTDSNGMGELARNYLITRGLDPDELGKKGFGYVDDPDSRYFGYIIVPVHNDSRLCFWLGRTFMDFKPKYLNESSEVAGIFYNDDLVYSEEKLYLVEGWTDAETMGNGIALLGKTLSIRQKTKLIRSIEAGILKELICVADGGFYDEMVAIAMGLFQLVKTKVVSLDVYGNADVNELGREKIYELEQRTDYITLENIAEVI
jgi:hypothetical protein